MTELAEAPTAGRDETITRIPHWIDGARVTDEILTSIKRAGADLIITYHALDFATRYAAR